MRPAVPSDLPALVELGTELREALLPTSDGVLRPGTPAARTALEQRYREVLACSDRRLVIVVGERDEPLAMALFSISPANPLLDQPAVHMSHSVVSRRYERRGAGKALVAAAAAYAEECGLDQLVVSVRPGSREANRFFSRLGFAPLAVRRVAPVSAVRRRLAQAERDDGAHVTRRRPRRVVPAPASSVRPLAASDPDL